MIARNCYYYWTYQQYTNSVIFVELAKEYCNLECQNLVLDVSYLHSWYFITNKMIWSKDEISHLDMTFFLCIKKGRTNNFVTLALTFIFTGLLMKEVRSSKTENQPSNTYNTNWYDIVIRHFIFEIQKNYANLWSKYFETAWYFFCPCFYSYQLPHILR